tara:strand:- start:2 stop:502 length:501 start_codon:yes stop_codon:yes gene_type:complete
MVVEVIDNFLSDSEHTAMAMYCHNATYQYGEVDHPGVRPTGMTHHIDDNSAVFKLLEHKTMPLMLEKYPKAYIYRMYVNCFAPNEHPNFHVDNQDDNTPAITMLYYPNKKWKPDDGGETQLYIDHEIRGLVPRPNRLVYFDANILHRATTFRNRHRFTMAIKYSLE